MSSQPPSDPMRRTSPLELLWDLVFVFAVTQVTTLLARELSWAGLARSMLALALVWWAWSAFVWATNAQDPNGATMQGTLLLSTALIFVAGLALPHAYGRYGTLFAVAYSLVRFLHLALYVDASRRGNASLAAIAGFAVTVAIGMALLIGGSFAPGWWRVGLWALAAAIDYAGPAWLTRERLRGLQRVAVAHFAERYGLFVIICLGESIVAIGVGAGSHALSARAVVGVSLALLITIGLWWVYFARFADIAEQRLSSHEDPVLAAADAYSYLHLLLVAGIIVFAVGAKRTVSDLDAALPTGARLALCGGVALYLAGHVAFQARLTRRLHAAQVVAAGACMLVFVLVGHGAAWVSAAAVMLVLLALLAYERLTPLRRWPPHRTPRPPRQPTARR